MKRSFILLLFFFAAQISLCPASGGRDILSPKERQWLKKHDGKIRYALLHNYPPIEFIDSDGRHRGVAADYVTLIEKRLDFRFFKVRSESWQAIIEKA